MSGNPETIEETKSKTKIGKPSMYKVILLNDDYTTTEFVIAILKDIFHKSDEEATIITARVHETGAGIAGIYTREIAESKVAEVIVTARHYQFPLQAVTEKE